MEDTSSIVSYKWTISSGEIVDGQGTSIITVATPKENEVTVTAMVEISKLKAGCPTTASDTYSAGSCRLFPELVDTFGRIVTGDVKARLDNFYIRLQDAPNARGVIVNYGRPAQIKNRRTLMLRAISFRKYDESRVTFIDGGNPTGGAETKFWFLPAGTGDPEI